ncbi:MAG: hypothetical protein EBR01_13600 [Proteobacteria bacterium]|nr:hypothetical protein [Pseudomonadota bacterium]
MSQLKIIAAVVFSFFLFLPASFSKEPAFILYNDGTWEKAGSSALSAPNTATLKIQAGLTMRSGDTKPVSNTKVVLTKIGIPQICKTWKVFMDGPNGGKNLTVQWSSAALLAGYMTDRKQQLLTINQALAMEKVAEDTTDFNGQAVFTALPIRRVYVNVLTELGGRGGLSAWSVPSDLKPGDNKLILSNDNLDEDFD